MVMASTGRAGPPRLLLTVVLCALVAMLDGFDTQSIAFVAPTISRSWGLPVARFGNVFGAGLLGLTFGSLVFGPIADTVGRRPVILLSTLTFGVLSLLTAWAHNETVLLVLRFLTGLGLGAAMPNIIALTSEQAPSALRARVITVMFAGIPFGAAIGGFASAHLIAAFGWQSVFVVGGAAPLVLAVALWLLLPESSAFLEDRVERKGTRRTLDAARGAYALFTEGRGLVTSLLWLAFFANLLVMYFLINWLPTLAREAGLSLQASVSSTATLTIGGTVGALVLGFLIDRWGPVRVISLACAAAAVCIVVMAHSIHDPWMLFGTIFLVGFGIIGSQVGMNVIAAAAYPTSIRATGSAWSLSVGRVGSIVGPVIGGLFLTLQWTASEILVAACIPAFFAALAIAGLAIVPRLEAVEHVDSPIGT